MLKIGCLKKLWIRDCGLDRYCGLDQCAVDIICVGLTQNATLEDFRLNDTKKPNARVGRSLAGMSSLRHVHLSILDGNEWIIPFFEGARNASHLQSITMGECYITRPCAEAIVRMLTGNTTLRSIAFKDCIFDEDAMTLILSGLSETELLESLTVDQVSVLLDDFEQLEDETLTRMVLSTVQQNPSLTTLRVSALQLPISLVAIAEGLADLDRLCVLQIGQPYIRCEYYSRDFFAALLRSLEQNTTLKYLELWGMLDGDMDDAKPFLPMIDFFLSLNLVGHFSLLRADVPLGLWAHVLARKPILAQFFLTNKPNIIVLSE
jgi:hypothetical protein